MQYFISDLLWYRCYRDCDLLWYRRCEQFFVLKYKINIVDVVAEELIQSMDTFEIWTT